MNDQSKDTPPINFIAGEEFESVESVAMSLQEPTDSPDTMGCFVEDERSEIPMVRGRQGSSQSPVGGADDYSALRKHLQGILDETSDEDSQESKREPRRTPDEFSSQGSALEPTLRGVRQGDRQTPKSSQKSSSNKTLMGLPITRDEVGSEQSAEREEGKGKTEEYKRRNTLSMPRMWRGNGPSGHYQGSGLILLQTSEIQEAVGTGVFRLRIGGEEFGPVDESAIIELFKHGIFMGDGEIAEVDGPWMPVMDHPIFIRLQGRMATKAHRLLQDLNIPGRAQGPERQDPLKDSFKQTPSSREVEDEVEPAAPKKILKRPRPAEGGGASKTVERAKPVDPGAPFKIEEPVEALQVEPNKDARDKSVLPLLTHTITLLIGVIIGLIMSGYFL